MSGIRSAQRKTATLQHRIGLSRTFQRKMASGLLGKFCRAKDYRRGSVDIGRNDPCPCGSGKKWKKCHGS